MEPAKDADVDTTLIDYFLSLSPEERIACNERQAEMIVQLRRAGGIDDDRFDDRP
jgi:hypothetical protein